MWMMMMLCWEGEGRGRGVNALLLLLLEACAGEAAKVVSHSILPKKKTKKKKKKKKKKGRAMAMANDPLQCCVCMVGRRGAALIPCGHTFCRSCSKQLFAERGACPLCNNLIVQVLHIF